MRRLSLAAPCLAAALLLLMTGSALASHDPGGAPFDEDFVTGTAAVTPDPMDPCSDCKGIQLDARSGPLGENPFGSAQYSLRQNYSGGPVTCLTVDGHRAVVGGQDDVLWGAYLILVEDNAGIGTPDGFAYNFLSTPSGLPEPPAACPNPDDFVPNDGPVQTVVNGDLVVHDAGPPDTRPPNVSIVSAPKGKIKTRKRFVDVSFELQSDEPDVTFECRINRLPAETCSSPVGYRLRATRGAGSSYELTVRAVDVAGNRSGRAIRQVQLIRRIRAR